MDLDGIPLETGDEEYGGGDNDSFSILNTKDSVGQWSYDDDYSGVVSTTSYAVGIDEESDMQLYPTHVDADEFLTGSSDSESEEEDKLEKLDRADGSNNSSNEFDGDCAGDGTSDDGNDNYDQLEEILPHSSGSPINEHSPEDQLSLMRANEAPPARSNISPVGTDTSTIRIEPYDSVDNSSYHWKRKNEDDILFDEEINAGNYSNHAVWNRKDSPEPERGSPGGSPLLLLPVSSAEDDRGSTPPLRIIAPALDVKTPWSAVATNIRGDNNVGRFSSYEGVSGGGVDTFGRVSQHESPSALFSAAMAKIMPNVLSSNRDPNQKEDQKLLDNYISKMTVISSPGAFENNGVSENIATELVNRSPQIKEEYPVQLKLSKTELNLNDSPNPDSLVQRSASKWTASQQLLKRNLERRCLLAFRKVRAGEEDLLDSDTFSELLEEIFSFPSEKNSKMGEDEYSEMRKISFLTSNALSNGELEYLLRHLTVAKLGLPALATGASLAGTLLLVLIAYGFYSFQDKELNKLITNLRLITLNLSTTVCNFLLF